MTLPRPRSSTPPLATYRLQFNEEFTFAAASEVVDYLSELGISHLYASPLFEARPGSTHGYDVCSFERLNPRLGTETEFDGLVQQLHADGMGLLLDIVPNHMAADPRNVWWADVLEQGEQSLYARWFDIEWEPAEEGLHHRVLLPVLEDHFGRVLEAGKLRVSFEKAGFFLRYHDRRFPLSLASREQLAKELLETCAHSPATRSLISALQRLSSGDSRESSLSAEREHLTSEDMAFIKCDSPAHGQLQALLNRINGVPGDPATFTRLQSLLRAQHYRLAYWRLGSELINYRRFFDVAELVSLRMELPEVFAATHKLVFKLMAEQKVDGLRIDHPDGLWDPKEYLDRLKGGCLSIDKSELVEVATSGAAREGQRAPKEGHGGVASPYLIVEKILSHDEALPRDWPVAGTTGYDFLNKVNGLFIDPANRQMFDRLYADFSGEADKFESVIEKSKKHILANSFAGEVTALARRLRALASTSRYGQDFSRRELRRALVEVITAFPVYRTYSHESADSLSEVEAGYVRQAVARARSASPELDPAVFDFVQNVLLRSFPADVAGSARTEWRRWVMKWQQLTGPVMAKGLEDTAFYNYNRLISLNEVGGAPDEFGTTVSEFHRHNARMATAWPHSLLATATHDTKRGEDARTRIDVLSEMPQEWGSAVARWQVLNRSKKSRLEGHWAPRANDEYFLYQTLIGAWPSDEQESSELGSFTGRITEYLRKALREAKAHTSWTKPVAAYEEATRQFAERVLSEDRNNAFLRDFRRFQRQVAFFGKLNSLSQTLLKMTAPGVPDFYQGTELWDLSLVDPDNRRPVSFSLRRRLLQDLKDQLASPRLETRSFFKHLWEDSDSGQIKQFLIWRTLELRRKHVELFQQGAYFPLEAHGAHAEHLCAFARASGDQVVIVIAPRLIRGLVEGVERLPLGQEVWRDTRLFLGELPSKLTLRNVLTHETVSAQGHIPAAAALSTFPVALLKTI